MGRNLPCLDAVRIWAGRVRLVARQLFERAGRFASELELSACEKLEHRSGLQVGRSRGRHGEEGQLANRRCWSEGDEVALGLSVGRDALETQDESTVERVGDSRQRVEVRAMATALDSGYL